MGKIIHSVKKFLLLKGFFWIIINTVLILPFFAKAATGGETGDSANIPNPLGDTATFSELILKITNIVLKIGYPIAVIFIIYSGLLFVTARGSEEKLKTAKKTFLWAILGTAVLLGATVLAEAIKATIESF